MSGCTKASPAVYCGVRSCQSGTLSVFQQFPILTVFPSPSRLKYLSWHSQPFLLQRKTLEDLFVQCGIYIMQNCGPHRLSSIALSIVSQPEENTHYGMKVCGIASQFLVWGYGVLFDDVSNCNKGRIFIKYVSSIIVLPKASWSLLLRQSTREQALQQSSARIFLRQFAIDFKMYHWLFLERYWHTQYMLREIDKNNLSGISVYKHCNVFYMNIWFCLTKRTVLAQV